MTGRRIYQVDNGGLIFQAPGDYGSIDVGDGEKWWYACLPNWGEASPMARHGVGIGSSRGTRNTHLVTEHEDGTITVSPSILWNQEQMPTHPETWWHGFLEHGVWREV